MKRGILASYVSGVCDVNRGESYGTILRLFYPEFISSLVLFCMINLLDARFVTQLHSTSTYAAFGVTNTFLDFLMKIAEGISLVITITAGHYNGAGEYKRAGRAMVEIFWIIVVVAATLCGLVYFGAYAIYWFLDVPQKMIGIGVPFLQWRMLSLFFAFLYFAFTAFLRSIKNTQLPMRIYVAGAALFVFFDYALIFGKFGFPEMRLTGSAMASFIQYAFMFVALASAVIFDNNYRKYSIDLFSGFADWGTIKRILNLSWPLIIDKAIMAGAYIWLSKMIAPMGKYVLASYGAIKLAEKIVFMPAIAMAPIITLMTSNDFGRGNIGDIKPNIKKVLFLAFAMVFFMAFFFFINPTFFLSFFDPKGKFTVFAGTAFQVLILFIFFDLIQLILAGAMRGIGNVRYVMFVRFIGMICFFVPASYIMAHIPMQNALIKFILIYAMFFVGSIFMSILYIRKFRSDY